MNSLYPRVADRAEHRCEYCRAPENIYNFLYEVEHIVPVSQGGTDSESNLALACRACNIYKSDFTVGYDAETQAHIRLFNPRQDEWNDHFRVDTTTATIIGRTPIDALRLRASKSIKTRKLSPVVCGLSFACSHSAINGVNPIECRTDLPL